MPNYARRWDEKSTSDSDSLVCPYCGYKHTDPWERFESEDATYTVECAYCEKEFMAEVSKTITYYGCPKLEESK